MSVIKELPKGWVRISLKHVTTIFPGYGFPTALQGKKTGKYAFYKVGDISKNVQTGNKYLELCDNYIDEDELNKIKAKPYPINTIVFAKIGEALKLNRRAITKRPGIVDNNAIGVKAVERFMNDLYLFFYMTTVKLEDYSRATTVPSVRKTDIEEIPFPLPPLPEQHRIVARIEELFSDLDKGIESLKTAQQQLKVYRQAVLKWAFEGRLTNKDVKEGELPEGWKKHKLGKVIQTIDGDRGPNYPKKEELLREGYCLFLSTKNVREDRFVFDENIFISKEKDGILRNGKLQLNDVVVTTRGTLGNVALYDEKVNFKNIRINSGMLILRITDTMLNNYYLMKFITSPQFHRQLKEKQSGTAQPQIPANVLREIEMPIPQTLNEQLRIVSEIEDRLSVCDKMEESISQSLQQAEALRQSILKKAFEGKLVPQDSNDEPASVLLERIRAEKADVPSQKKGRKGKTKA